VAAQRVRPTSWRSFVVSAPAGVCRGCRHFVCSAPTVTSASGLASTQARLPSRMRSVIATAAILPTRCRRRWRSGRWLVRVRH
jgi:hypothetical protein